VAVASALARDLRMIGFLSLSSLTIVRPAPRQNDVPVTTPARDRQTGSASGGDENEPGAAGAGAVTLSGSRLEGIRADPPYGRG
jgi:hypothetical protein